MEKTGKSTGEKKVVYSQPSVESMNRGREKAGRTSKNRAILRKWRKRP